MPYVRRVLILHDKTTLMHAPAPIGHGMEFHKTILRRYARTAFYLLVIPGEVLVKEMRHEALRYHRARTG